jgi:hypothetical protein
MLTDGTPRAAAIPVAVTGGGTATTAVARFVRRRPRGGPGGSRIGETR